MTDFPTINAVQPALRGVQDTFVAKLDRNGSQLLYSTYLGGSGGDEGTGIAADNRGNAYVTGITNSRDFPTVNPLSLRARATEFFHPPWRPVVGFSYVPAFWP
jgi:Beta-propeller repeat